MKKFLKLYGRKCFSHFALTVPKSDLLTEYMTLLMFLEAEAKQLAFDRGPSFFCDVQCECGRRLYYYKKRCVAPCNQCCFKLGRLEVFLTSDQIEADYRLDSKEYAIRQFPFRKMRKRSFPRCLSCGHLFRFTDPELSLCNNCIEDRGISLPFVKDKGITDTISCSICHKMYDVEFLFNIDTGDGPGFQCIRCSGKDKIVTYIPPPVPLIFSGDVEENPGPFSFLSAYDKALLNVFIETADLFRFGNHIELCLKAQYGCSSVEAHSMLGYWSGKFSLSFESSSRVDDARNALTDYRLLLDVYARYQLEGIIEWG